VLWDTADVHPGYYNRAQGCADGAAAYLMAQAVVAQPSGSVIYFAVPEMAGADDAAGLYFEGVNQAFRAAGPDERQYQVGVYGAGGCCERMVARGLASAGWLADDDEQAYAGYSLRQQADAVLPVDDGQRISVGMARTSAERPAGLFRVL